MLSSLKALATPFTLGLFLISAVSGVALFFHLGEGSFHEMHEWLSMALLIPVGVHVWRNWAGLTGYVKRGRLLLPVGLSCAVALGFAAPGLLDAGGGGNPGFAAVNLLLQERLSTVAPAVRLGADQLASRLRAMGYTITANDATLRDIAVASGREPPRIVSDLATLTTVRD